ncbi:MAG: S-methyl-5-thioribose kinase [Firmicutes bacterium]|nr:S-methyl-5-thioribose kinase [Bacillota bacterium]
MKYDTHFLMTEADAINYAKDYLKYFQAGEVLTCEEIGDGNINYVFRLKSETTGKSLVIKQSDVLLRSAGRPLDTKHSRIEAEILKLQGTLAPGLVPEVYDYNETMCAISMEDISSYENTRKGLMNGTIYPTFVNDVVNFMVDTMLPTTDLVLGQKEKKERVVHFTNPELCEITEKLVLAEPFGSPDDDNVFTEENREFVRDFLYENSDIRAQVGLLRNNFMNNAQALIHGDLHTGSIFGNENGIKIIDPEFAFYGPMGYDAGNVIGNLFFSLVYWYLKDPENTEMIDWLTSTAATVFDRFGDRLAERWDELVTFDLYREPGFKKLYIAEVMADTVGYAGTEIIRRTVGSSKVAEVDAFPMDDPRRAQMERILIGLGNHFILNRKRIMYGFELIHILKPYLMMEK